MQVMLNKKLSTTLFFTQHTHLLIVILLFTFCISKVTVFKTLLTKATGSDTELYISQYQQTKTSIGNPHALSNITNELICEERYDDETKENHYGYSLDLLTIPARQTANTSSKEFVYFNSKCNYKTPLALYTLFCSWKDLIA